MSPTKPCMTFLIAGYCRFGSACASPEDVCAETEDKKSVTISPLIQTNRTDPVMIPGRSVLGAMKSRKWRVFNPKLSWIYLRLR
jgi:hypothetical protein